MSVRRRTSTVVRSGACSWAPSSAQALSARVANTRRREFHEAAATDLRRFLDARAATLDGGLVPGRESRDTTAERQGRPEVAIAGQACACGMLFTLQYTFYGRFSSNLQNLFVAVAHHAVAATDDESGQRWVSTTPCFADHPPKDGADPVVQKSLGANPRSVLDLLSQPLVGDDSVIGTRHTYEDLVRLAGPGFTSLLCRGHGVVGRHTRAHRVSSPPARDAAATAPQAHPSSICLRSTRGLRQTSMAPAGEQGRARRLRARSCGKPRGTPGSGLPRTKGGDAPRSSTAEPTTPVDRHIMIGLHFGAGSWHTPCGLPSRPHAARAP